MAYCTLARLGDDSVPPQALDRIRSTTRLWAARSLMIERTLLEFTSGCLIPAACAMRSSRGRRWRYYATPAPPGHARDIDVLIDHAYPTTDSLIGCERGCDHSSRRSQTTGHGRYPAGYNLFIILSRPLRIALSR